MVGGSLRVLRLLPPLKLVAMILLKMALSTINQSIQYLSLFISDGIISSKYYSKKKYIVVFYDELSKAALS
jgi:hypothetical protein